MAAPVFTTTTFSGTEDVKLTGTIAATDADKDTITYSLVSVPTTGIVALTNTTGAFSFTGKANWSGTETFQVKATDSKGESTIETITITFAPVVDAPASITVAPATAVIPALTVTGTDSGETLQGGLGKDTINAGGGDDIIYGDALATRTIALNIKGALADTDGSEALTFKLTNVPVDGVLSAGSKNVDGSWTVTAAETTGLALTTTAGANFTIGVTAIATETASGATATKAASIAVTVAAATGDIDTINAGDGNDTITGGKGGDIISGGAGDDTFVLNKGDGADIITDTSGNDTIVLGAGILKSAVTYARATNDLVVKVSSGEQITIKSHFTGNLVETLKFADGSTQNLGLLFNKAPVVTATTHAGYEDQAIKGQIVATDADKDKLTYSVVTGPANGQLTLDAATGAFSFLGNSNWSGADQFVVKADDGKGGIATQTVKVTAAAVGDAPSLSVGDVIATNGSDPIAGTIATETIRGGWGKDTITGNAGDDTIYGDGAAGFTVALDITSALADTDGSETLTVRVSNVPSDGVLSAGVKNADGSWTLTSDKLAGLTLTTASSSDFSLTVTAIASETANGSAATMVGTIAVTVPTGAGDADDLDGGIGADTLIGGVGNDMLSGGTGDDTYMFAKGDGKDTITDSSGYDVIRLGAGIVKADLSYAKTGSDLVIDIAGGDQLTVKNHFVTGSVEDLVLADGTHIDLVKLLDLSPTVNGGTFTGFEDRAVTGQVIASDLIDDTLTYALVAGPAHGKVALDAKTGAFTFNGAKDWAGTDTFTVKVSDSSGGETTKAINLWLSGVAEALTVTASARPELPASGTGWQRAVDIGVLGDVDGSEVYTYKLSGFPVYATPSAGTKNADGTWTLTAADLVGLKITGATFADFTVKVEVMTKEGNTTYLGAMGATTFAVTGQMANEWVVRENQAIDGKTHNLYVGDPAQTKYSIVDAPDHGIASMDQATGKFTYTPDANYSGLDTISVLVDGDVYDHYYQLKLNVTGIAEAPIITAKDVTAKSYGTVTGTIGADIIKGGTDGNVFNGGAGNDALYGDAGGQYILALDIAIAPADTDGSEAIYRTVFSSLPIGTTFSAGKAGNDPGTWIIESGNLAGVTMTTASVTDFDVVVTAYSRATASGTVAAATSSFTVHVPHGSGADVLKGQDGNDAIYGGIGNDEIDGGIGDDKLWGDQGDDNIVGGDGKDVLTGGTGNDSLDGGAGDDMFYGEDGDDWISTGEGLNVAYGGKGNDMLVGGSLKDKLDGGEGKDLLAGYLGDDVLFGGAGDDTVDGGEGNNLAFGGAGNDKVTGKAGNDLLYGDAGDDILDGGDGANLLNGGAGNDVMTAGAGLDKFYGGDGNDIAHGGGGADTFLGEAGDDTLYGEAGVDTLDGGDGNDLLYGGGDADVLKGSKGNDTLDGGLGADKLDGGDGNDLFIAGSDAIDTFAGGAGYDTLDYSGQSAAINVNLSKGTATHGVFVDKVATIEKIIATAFDDTLIGGSAADELVGGDGKDTIQGGAGSDILWGGDGADKFVWLVADIGTAKPRPLDTVKDFTLGSDVLDLRALLAGQTFAVPLDGVQARDTVDGTLVSASIKGVGFVDVVLLEGVHTNLNVLSQGNSLLLA